LKHRPGGTQIEGIETLRESAVYRREQLMGIAGPILGYSQPGEA
jgi:hypothetical protein